MCQPVYPYSQSYTPETSYEWLEEFFFVLGFQGSYSFYTMLIHPVNGIYQPK